MQFKTWMALGLCVLSGLAQAQSTSRYQTAYYASAYGQTSALLVDWFEEPYDLPHGSARLVDRQGKVTGQWWLENSGRMLALDQPRVLDGGTYYDSCAQNVPVRITQTRFFFRMIRGFSRRGQTAITVDEQGVVGAGCDAGKVLWTFTTADSTSPHNHMYMKARKGHDDLVAGGRIAGLTEAVREGTSNILQMPQDIARFEIGRSFVRFERSNTRVPYTESPTGWLVLNFPWGQRGFTRLELDDNNGEAWLMADLQDGEPKWVEEVLAVKPLRTATFGSMSDAARVWLAGFSLHQSNAWFLQRHFSDGSGERGVWNGLTGVGSFSPFTWRLEGANLVQQIPYGGTGYRLRTWEPMRTSGTVTWVMEEDIVYPASGDPWHFNLRRLHPQVDRGPALPQSVVKRQATQAPLPRTNEVQQAGLRNALAPSLQVRRW